MSKPGGSEYRDDGTPVEPLLPALSELHVTRAIAAETAE